MKLKSKLIIISVLFTVLAISFVGVILKKIVLDTFENVEASVFEQKINTFKSTVLNEFTRLETQLSDWAMWDLTYEFIHGENESYAADNIGKSVFTDLPIDYLALYDDNDNLLYGAYYNEDVDRLESLNESISNEFIQNKYETGLMIVNHEYIIYVSQQITDNEGEAVPKGNIVFAYTLDDDIKMRLEQINGVEISLNRVIEVNTIKYDSLLDYGIHSTLIHGDDESRGEIIFPFINDDAYIVLSFELGNEIVSLGKAYVNEGILYIFIVLTIFSVLLYIVLGRFVVQRIVSLNNQVKKISELKSNSERVNIKGFDELGELSGNINIMLNELESMHKEIEVYASFDDMTGAYNRRVGFEKLEYLINQCTEEYTFSIAYVDVNDLKKVNDKLGHNYGDQLLKDTINLIRAAVTQPNDIVRLGGDEFLIILPGLSQENTKEIMNYLNEKIMMFNNEHSRKYNVSISFGVVEYDKKLSVDLFVDKADQKMYNAKKVHREMVRQGTKVSTLI